MAGDSHSTTLGSDANSTDTASSNNSATAEPTVVVETMESTDNSLFDGDLSSGPDLYIVIGATLGGVLCLALWTGVSCYVGRRMASKKGKRQENQNDLSMVNFGPVSVPAEMSSARQDAGKSMRDIYSTEAVAASTTDPAVYNGGSVIALPPRPPASAGNTFNSDSLPPPPAPLANGGGGGGGIYVSSASSFGYASVEGSPYIEGGELSQPDTGTQPEAQDQAVRDAISQSSGYSNVPVSLLE